MSQIAELYRGNAYAHNLMMGDYFRFPGDGEGGKVYGPVVTADSSYNLEATWVRFADGADTLDLHAFRRVEITKRAPRCGCGTFFELCENECAWPEELERLWAAGF